MLLDYGSLLGLCLQSYITIFNDYKFTVCFRFPLSKNLQQNLCSLFSNSLYYIILAIHYVCVCVCVCARVRACVCPNAYIPWWLYLCTLCFQTSKILQLQCMLLGKWKFKYFRYVQSLLYWQISQNKMTCRLKQYYTQFEVKIQISTKCVSLTPHPEYFLWPGVVHLVDEDAGSLTPWPKDAAPRNLRPATVLHQIPVHVRTRQVKEVPSNTNSK